MKYISAILLSLFPLTAYAEEVAPSDPVSRIKWAAEYCDAMPGGYDAKVYFRFLYRGIFAALIAGFIFTACFSYDFWERKIWGNKFFVFLSSISYTVYLWHQNLYILFKRTNIPYSTYDHVMDDRTAMEGMVFLCISAPIIIGVLVTKYIEEPIVKYGFIGAGKKLMENIRTIPDKVLKSESK